MADTMIDLHTHSSCSDGRLKPADLMAAAADNGVSTIALTDHDTVAGLETAQAAGTKQRIALIAGVEISVDWQRHTLHVVGLAFNPQASTLTDGLKRLQASRGNRAERIAAKLERRGVNNALARATALAGGGQIGRPHFARLLIEDGICGNMQQAFKRYLRPGKPAYSATEWATLEDAIGWIADAGGIAVLAHPHGYRLTGAWRRRMVAAFAHAGGDAIEIGTGATDAQQEALSAAYAREHGLMGSVGSDFHAPEQHWLSLGGVRPVPADLTPVWDDPRFAPMN